jgi:hypothetical protein
MRRVETGTATCALCHQAIRPDADAVVTPDFIADDNDPFFRFSDATMHRVCFALWERRKTFVARFNQSAKRLRGDDGGYLQMTGDGDLVRRPGRRSGNEPPLS